MEDGSILLTLFNGGIRNDENEHIAKLLRRKSKILVSFGSCAWKDVSLAGESKPGGRDRSHRVQYDHHR